MFSSLNQGGLIYVLDKTTSPKFKIGEVVSVSLPHSSFTGLQSTVDIKLNIDGNIYEYNQIPASYSVITYNNGKITLSETKQGLQSEVELLLASSKQILDNIDTYKQNIEDCEEILKLLNPLFAKDKERDDRLNKLEDKFGGVEDKIDKILKLILTK